MRMAGRKDTDINSSSYRHTALVEGIKNRVKIASSNGTRQVEFPHME